uniref:Uncharacterized protein n=1 Tax=Sphenodon punctatus TaxID=8508 RepID=A0A8D0HGT2_SPHPU
PLSLQLAYSLLDVRAPQTGPSNARAPLPAAPSPASSWETPLLLAPDPVYKNSCRWRPFLPHPGTGRGARRPPPPFPNSGKVDLSQSRPWEPSKARDQERVQILLWTAASSAREGRGRNLTDSINQSNHLCAQGRWCSRRLAEGCTLSPLLGGTQVYSIISLQLLVTVGIIAVFTFVHPVRSFVQRNVAVYYTSYAVFLVTYLVLVCCEGPR